MNTFLKTYRLALTPLSPIHIGCGEDFEPTNYLIDDGVLYGFDPSRANLDERQRNDLSRLGLNADLLSIYQFFRDNKQAFKAIANVLIPVTSGVARDFQEKLARVVQRESDRKDVFNKLGIERAVGTGVARVPFIPGSSLKGSLRTSDLNQINDGRPIQYGEGDSKGGTSKLEKRLYEEKDFDTSPMRLVKVSDLMPNGDLDRSVSYAVMRRKRDPKTGEEKQTQDNLATRKEVISHGQYRKLIGEIVISLLGGLPESDNTPKKKFRRADLTALAHASNAYHLPKLEEELKILDNRRFASERWLVSLRCLLAGDLAIKLKQDTAFLVRLGRYGGAETKTLDGIRSIFIPQAKRQEERYVTSSHCLWLAANDAKSRSDMLPFGWAIVEIDPQEGDSPQLKAWCEAESKGRPDMVAKRREFEAERAAAAKRKHELLQEAEAREATKLADKIAAQRRNEILAGMTDQAREVELLRSKCRELEARLAGGGNFNKRAADANKPGVYQDATVLVKKVLESVDWSAVDRQALADMLELWMPKVVAPWDAKEQRKKLKFAILRGQ